MITCGNCGKQFNEPVEFCSRCGAPIDETMYDDLDKFTSDDDDILSMQDLDELETLMSGLSAQKLDPNLLEAKLKEADEDGNGLISLEELFAIISTDLSEDNANIFCDHFAETKNFTENGEVPIKEVVDMWIDFSVPLDSAANLDNVVVIKEILDAYKQERQFLDPTNILLDDEVEEFSYVDSFEDMIELIDVDKDGKLTDKEVRKFLSNFIPENELDVKVSAFMQELNDKQTEDTDDDSFIDIESISKVERSLEILDINSQITEDAKSDVDDLLNELNLPNFKDLSADNIFSEFDDLEDSTEETIPEPSEEIKPIFSRVRVKASPVPEEEEEEIPEKKDLSSLLDASDEELEALLNESGGDLGDMFGTNSEEEFSVPKFSIDNIFDDFDETPVDELANKLNNNFQYDEDDDEEDDLQEKFHATPHDDDDDDNDDDFESQFMADDYSPDIYEQTTDEDFSGVFEELLVSPESFDEKVEQDELDEALKYIKENSDEDTSKQVSARITKDFENYEDIFEEASHKSTAKDAIFEEDPTIADISTMGPDDFFTNEELTNALLDIKDITDKKKEKKVEEKESLTSKIKSKFFLDLKTGVINAAFLITLIITGFSVYYVQKKPYQNTFYTNYSEEVVTLYDQDTWDAYLSVVGFNNLFLIYANSYLDGELSKDEFLKIGNEYISHNTRSSKTFLTNTYPESADYAYDLHLYTFKFTELADTLLTAVADDAPQSEVESYVHSMEAIDTLDTSLLLEREKFLQEVGLYN